ININELITRVSANEEKKLELDTLKNERSLLTNKYSDINQKFDVLIKEQEHQLNLYMTQKENQKVEIERDEIQYLSKLNSEYDKLFDSLEIEHETELKDKENELTRKVEDIHILDKQKVGIKHTKLYEKEIEQAQKEINDSNLAFKQESNNISTYKQQIETLQTKWNFENSEAEKNSERTKERLQEALNIAVQNKNDTEEKINKSKDSLYGWLNQNKPGWENSIGKVIDENLLFQDGLSPKLIDGSSLYGLEINLNEIESKIKTIDDYQFELGKLSENIEHYQNDIQELTNSLKKEKENIQRRNLPKIKTLKEKVRQAEYLCEQQKRQIEKSELDKGSFTNKALNEKLEALEKIQVEIDKAIVLREKAAEALELSKSKLRKNKENKQKEKTRRTNELKGENKNKILMLQQQIEEKQNQINKKIASLKNERNGELDNKGADTGRLSEIEKQIT
ncbi:ATP-binding protein, partial [Echinicola sediminis]